jgi:tetratricopeptide (TPR) repeat protein
MINAGEAPTEQKLRMSFYVLEENFSLNNRTQKDVKRNESLLPLAESAVSSALEFYPNHNEFVLAAIRTLYVEGNYYLRTERFTRALQKLILAKELCERHYPGLEDRHEEVICENLAHIDPKFPSLYSLVLHHLGQIPLYHKESPLGIDKAEKYLKKSCAIRDLIDNSGGRFANVIDNNDAVGDAVIFKRTLGYIYLQTGRFDEAEHLYLDLLKINDPFNQLISHRQLFKVYQFKGQQAQDEFTKKLFYQKAIESAQHCLKLIEKDIGNYTRVSSVYKDIGNLYSDNRNPFQDIEESYRILELAKQHCPNQLKVTSQHLKEELSNALKKLSQKELEEAIQMRWKTAEEENVDSLQFLNDQKAHILNYEMLGEIYLEQKAFILASAFFSNGLSLALRVSNSVPIYERLYQRLTLTEKLFLKENGINIETEYKTLDNSFINSYKAALKSLRNETEILLEKKETIQKIYCIIAEKYKVIVQRLIEDIFLILGPPPTENYAFIGFGSLGRSFATPYSDLEFAILIAEEKHKPYFKMLSQLLHVRVNTLCEAPIATFGIKSLQWLTEKDGPSDRGFMLDPWNMVPHIPLYKDFEMIATPHHLASLFEPSFSELSPAKKSVLYTFTHLYGNQNLTDEYEIEVNNVLSNHNARTKLSEAILWSDLEAYNTHLGTWLDQGQSYYFKRDFYRPFTNALDALALQNAIHILSPWQIVDELYSRAIIDEELHLDLINALDEIGLLRLKTFIKYGKQDYTIYPTNYANEKSLQKSVVEEERLMKLLQTYFHLRKKITMI